MPRASGIATPDKIPSRPHLNNGPYFLQARPVGGRIGQLILSREKKIYLGSRMAGKKRPFGRKKDDVSGGGLSLPTRLNERGFGVGRKKTARAGEGDEFGAVERAAGSFWKVAGG